MSSHLKIKNNEIRFSDNASDTNFDAQTCIQFSSTQLDVSGSVYPKTTQIYNLGGCSNPTDRLGIYQTGYPIHPFQYEYNKWFKVFFYNVLSVYEFWNSCNWIIYYFKTISYSTKLYYYCVINYYIISYPMSIS